MCSENYFTGRSGRLYAVYPQLLRGVLLPGAPDLSSFNDNLSAFQYNRKSNFFAECVLIVPASVPKNLWYNLNIMNVFIILSILIIVIGVLLIVVTPSVLFKFNWNEKTGLEKILVILFYCILLYIINIIYWFIKWKLTR